MVTIWPLDEKAIDGHIAHWILLYRPLNELNGESVKMYRETLTNKKFDTCLNYI